MAGIVLFQCKVVIHPVSVVDRSGKAAYGMVTR